MSRGRKGSESSRNSKRNWHFSSHSFGFGTATFYLRLHWTLSSPQAPVVLIGGDVVFTSQTIDHVQQGPCSLQLEHDPWIQLQLLAFKMDLTSGSHHAISHRLSPLKIVLTIPSHLGTTNLQEQLWARATRFLLQITLFKARRDNPITGVAFSQHGQHRILNRKSDQTSPLRPLSMLKRQPPKHPRGSKR